MPVCTLKVARIGDGYRIRIEGRGTAEESPALAAFVSQCTRAEERAKILIDLSACEYLDSTFLGCLVTLDRECRKCDETRFQILADAERREKLLTPTRIDRLLNFADGDPNTLSGYVTMEPARLNELEFGRHVLESHRVLAGVPSTHAQIFQEIADKLERELKD
ncbi:MAG: STAS domain-containing protein, partial [Pirellulaceae bacterium]